MKDNYCNDHMVANYVGIITCTYSVIIIQLATYAVVIIDKLLANFGVENPVIFPLL